MSHENDKRKLEVENLIKLLKKNIPWNANNIIESKLLSHPKSIHDWMYKIKQRKAVLG